MHVGPSARTSVRKKTFWQSGNKLWLLGRQRKSITFCQIIHSTTRGSFLFPFLHLSLPPISCHLYWRPLYTLLLHNFNRNPFTPSFHTQCFFSNALYYCLETSRRGAKQQIIFRHFKVEKQMCIIVSINVTRDITSIKGSLEGNPK